jgi:proteasome-associated ATPase
VQRPKDPNRQRKSVEDFLQDYQDMEYTFQSLSLIDQLLVTIGEKDKRSRALLSQLRRQLQEDQITFQEARKTIVELEGALEKVTAPANRIGTYLGSPNEGIAYVSVGGSDYYTNIDPRVDAGSLRVGTRVLVNEAFAVVGDLGYSPSGPVGKVIDILSDGRLRVGQEHGLQAVVLERSSALRELSLKVGEDIRIDPCFKVALERLTTPETKDYYLEDVPELPWNRIGGQQEAIQAIKDTIEMPALHPELFRRFQYSTPKGFLLYGPPGCGKTLIGKATAYNLVRQLNEESGEQLKECFMHVKGPEILNMWLGESERIVREIFARAREKRKEGFLPVVFIDEAESVLGTRRAIRSHNISNTVVPMFCSEMDGIESLQDVILILASNRPDLIDPAILRPGRIDRKIKVVRPDKGAALDIFGIYMTTDLPVHPEALEPHGGDAAAAVRAMLERANEELFARREDTQFLEVTLRSGRRDILHRGDLVSGAIIASIVQRAKESAIKRAIATGVEGGISAGDLTDAVVTEYGENEIFPPTDNAEDWLKLLDYDPENVARVTPIRPENAARKRPSGVI